MLIETHSLKKFPYCECGGLNLWNVHSTQHLREVLEDYIDKEYKKEQEVFGYDLDKEEMFYSIDELIENSKELSLDETGLLLSFET